MDNICALNQARDPQNTGGKAANLCRLAEAGVNVPAGFVVLADSFREHAEHYGINVGGLKHIADGGTPQLEQASRRLQEAIMASPLDHGLEAQVLQAFERLQAKSVAVRSSAIAEDGQQSAWAGQLESYLYVKSPAELLDAIRRCWASMFFPRAILYRLKHGLPDEPAGVAVVVQAMIEAQKAGVAFTADPVSGERSLVVEAVWGDCEQLVSGQINPDHYVLDAVTGIITEKSIAAQPYFERNGAKHPVPADKQSRQKLTDQELQKLADICWSIEAYFGTPQDIEWVHDGTQFFIVQSRPITTLAAKPANNHLMPQPEQYAILFRLKDKANFFLNTFLLNGSLRFGDLLLVNREGYWTSYLRKSRQRALAQKGYELLSDQAQFGEYEHEFRDYLHRAETSTIPMYRDNPPSTGTQIKEFVKDVGQLWYFYGFTEYPYHDYAYQCLELESDESKKLVLARNLQTLVELKDMGRKVFNAYVMRDGLIQQALQALAAKSGLPEDACSYLTLPELCRLADGQQPDHGVAEQRHRAYVILVQNHEEVTLGHEDAQQVASRFHSYEQEFQDNAKDLLEGVTASAGKATGRVVVSPMLDRAAAEQVAARMQKGDILVAQSTNPNLMMLCEKAGAIITDQGGMLSHAAIISRELKIPCIVGTVIATKVLHDGDLIEVDATNATIRRLVAGK